MSSPPEHRSSPRPVGGARPWWAVPRREIGRIAVYSLHAPPLSWLVLPVVPLAVAVVSKIESRAAWLGRSLRAIYYLTVLSLFVGIHGFLPFLLAEDFEFGALGIAATLAIQPGKGGVRRYLALAAVFGILELALPPLHHRLGERLLFAVAAFAGTAALGIVVGRDAIRSIPALALGVAITNAGIWGRQLVFYNAPGEGARARVAGVPGVRLVPVPELPWQKVTAARIFFADPPRLVLEDCSGEHFLLGWVRGLVRFPRLGPGPTEVVDLATNNDVGLDCATHRLYVGHIDTIRGTDDAVAEVDLDSFRVTRRMDYCPPRTPDTVRVDLPRGRLYAFDDSGAIQEIDLEGFTCGPEIPGTFVRDFAVDPRTGDLVVWDEGRLKLFDVAANRFVHDFLMPSPRALPHRFARHYGRVLIDSDARAVWLADLNNGLLHGLDLASWSITSTLDLGRGIRHLALDRRRGLLYVGNYLTGDLEVVERSPARRIGSAFVGRRMRAMWISQDGDRLSFASEVGPVSIDLEEFLAGLHLEVGSKPSG